MGSCAPLCRIAGKGSVSYRREDADTPQAEDVLYRVEDIATRSGLIQKEQLFSPEQSIEIDLCCAIPWMRTSLSLRIRRKK